MGIKQVQVGVNNLLLGMYVSRLDRPWSETPFALQGFYIRSPGEINQLKTYCSHIFVDIEKGRSPLGKAIAPVIATQSKKTLYEPLARSTARVGRRPVKKSKEQTTVAPLVVRKGVYETSVSLRKESVQAKKIVSRLKGSLTLVVKQINRGKSIDYGRLKDSVGDMVDSVLRCPDAFTWLVRLRDQDIHSYDHSLRSALWAVQFARYIGMPKDEIAVLCMGTLLKDVGKAKLPSRLLRKEKRSDSEEQEYRKYVSHGVELLRQTQKIEPRVISVVRYHAERNDGSGYPEGLTGGKIPLLARIAGIASTYDSICYRRDALEPLSPSRAVGVLYGARDKQFSDDLVVSFIQSIGLYPTGTLVELTTGDIGVVTEQHPKSRLTPKVAVLGREGTELTDAVIIVDLKDEEKARQALSDRDGGSNAVIERAAIARDLEPSGYDVDLSKISHLFIAQELDDSKGLFSGLRQRLHLG
ncbi:hypothetical protein A9Q89_05685 [Gammaproteobacteria bacterium 53_120_T64]|nr:hypothetical protein A9Q89_05685 [Gammaproteobacteria bacterium 53_120_T64]